MAALKASGFEDNTVISIWGDHGVRITPHPLRLEVGVLCSLITIVLFTSFEVYRVTVPLNPVKRCWRPCSRVGPAAESRSAPAPQWQLGEHGEWCKHTNFEFATRAPMIIKVPGLTDGGLTTTLYTEHVDL